MLQQLIVAHAGDDGQHEALIVAAMAEDMERHTDERQARNHLIAGALLGPIWRLPLL